MFSTIISWQVVREACITIAYMSQQMRQKVDRFCEALMQVHAPSGSGARVTKSPKIWPNLF
jgi:hypothetical protein